jgi:hypothetical protein
MFNVTGSRMRMTVFTAARAAILATVVRLKCASVM